ncbi:MAG: sulfatase [Tannerellaceae bacterium]
MNKLFATSFLLANACQLLHAAERPNIVLFLVDDMGWQDTSVPFASDTTPFNRIYQTPNMEHLAAHGVKFTNAYASSVSSPSRVSLFTGMNAARHRVTNWTLEYNKSVDGRSDRLTYPEWNINGMSPTPGVEHTCLATPLPQMLHDGGYYTIHCGKAHFGAISTPAANPLNLGFDVNIAGHAAGGLASYLGEENYGNRTDGKPSSLFAVPGLEKYHGTDVFVTEALTREAVLALDARPKEKPFFLYMSHYAVHIPINRDKRFYDKYAARGMDPREAAYAALVEGMDKSLGDLMDYLDKNHLTENTIIVFMSDNGGLSAQNSRGGELNTHNLPLKSGKGSAYEGGIREPMIVCWPGVTKPATVCKDYLLIEDFYPTLLEMAGVRMSTLPQVVDGRSFVPLLTGKGKNPAKGRALIWNFPNNWGPTGPGIGATCTIRKGDWKLIYYYESGVKELFNLSRDLGENQNLASAKPAKVKKLSRELGTYLRSVGGQRPAFKATGQPAPWPDEVPPLPRPEYVTD